MRRWVAGGVRQDVPETVTNGRRLATLYDEARHSRRHLFVMTAGWKVDDPTVVMRSEDVNLDAETLVLIAGPGCYVCEVEWSPGMEGRPCPGEPA
jgi:hypothetical protein